MRYIDSIEIKEAVKNMAMKASIHVDDKVLSKLKELIKAEDTPLPVSILGQIIENDELALKENIPLCQDTGIAIIFLEIGQDVHVNGNIEKAINEGVSEAYREAYLRKSVVSHPIKRVNSGDNTPAIIHTKIVDGENIRIRFAPKGAGSENMSAIKMLTPSDGVEGIKKFIIDTVKNSSGKPCPPIIVGVGIGGNFEKSAIMAKEALLRDFTDSSSDKEIAELEHTLFEEINKLNIGPMGLGGKTTALAVKINYYPCHIASLPVAVNIQCHASRHEEVIL